jgi:hypothetical protein
MYYNELLSARFRGIRLTAQTVQYVRYPGNSYDRQYAKFCRPFGTVPDARPPEEALRLRLCEVIFRQHLERLAAGAVTTLNQEPIPTI